MMGITGIDQGIWRKYVMPALLILLAGCDLFGGGDPNDIEFRVRGNAVVVGIAGVNLETGRPVYIGYINAQDPNPTSLDDRTVVDDDEPILFAVITRCGSVLVCETSSEIRAGGKTIARAELGRDIEDPQAFGASYILGAVARLGADSVAVRFEIEPEDTDVYYAIDGGVDDLELVGAGLDVQMTYAAGDTAALYFQMGSNDGTEVCADARVSIAVNAVAWMPVAGGSFCGDRAAGRITLRAAIPE